MMRSRIINPEFFRDERIAELDYVDRLVFIGLWCIADKFGRFRWSEKRLKADILPYDDVDFKNVMMDLIQMGLIVSYKTDTYGLCGYIPNFLKYQKPHKREALSTIPAPPDEKSENIQTQTKIETEIETKTKTETDGVGEPRPAQGRPHLSKQVQDVITNKHGHKILMRNWDWNQLDRLEIPDKWVLDLYDQVFDPQAPGWIKKYIGWLEGRNAAKNIINHKAELDKVVEYGSTESSEYLEDLQRRAANDTSTGL